MAHVWVVEMWHDERERWEPCVGIGLTREDAREEREVWKLNNPDDRFRIEKYVGELRELKN